MIRREDYIKTVNRPYPPFYSYLITVGYINEKNYVPFIGHNIEHKDIIVSRNIWYYHKKSIELAAEITFKKWLNVDNFNRAVKAFEIQEDRLIKAAQKDLDNFSKEYQAYMPAVLLPWCIENLVAEKLKKLLPGDLLDQLNIPLRDNFYKQEEYELVQSNNLEEHVKKFEWINSRYGESNPYTLEMAKEKLSQINKDDFLKKYQEEKNKIKEVILKAKAILSKENQVLVDVMQFIVYYRTQRTDIINKASYLFMPILQNIAKENKLTYQQVLYCTVEEINKNTIDINIINQRIKKHTILVSNGDIKILIGKEADEVDNIFLDDISNIKKLTGQVACRGVVIGNVRIIFSRKDFDSLENGDVLVTSMTTPEMLPIMKKAVAFVTNEGGITCHAAIISREMNKPCIIGTKIATDFLKNGDRIEVDANLGEIKKI